jgi:hypothetical protein
MPDHDPRDQISHLEARVDELADIIERCRKIILAAKIAIAAGALWLLAGALGAIQFDAVMLIAATTAIMGGIVVFGSNTSTAKQAAGQMKDAEALRAELIGRLELRVVDAEQTKERS